MIADPVSYYTVIEHTDIDMIMKELHSGACDIVTSAKQKRLWYIQTTVDNKSKGY